MPIIQSWPSLQLEDHPRPKRPRAYRTIRTSRLVMQSYRLLIADRELMSLVLLAGLAIILLGLAIGYWFGARGHGWGVGDSGMYLSLFVLYLVGCVIGVFCQAAIVAAATTRLRGGAPSVAAALRAAGTRVVPLLLWGVVAATVDVVVRSVAERDGRLSRSVAFMGGTAWLLATFFVVPALVLEKLSPRESLARSTSLITRHWGESVIGNVGVNRMAWAVWLVLIGGGVILAAIIGWAAVIVFGVCGVLLIAFFTALHGVYLAWLYRYATEGSVSEGFDEELLGKAFKARVAR